ncbi:MAG: ATP-binding protein [Thermodesulfobacteriota bacterium]
MWREIVVISGKGGTGKTSLTAAFAHLATDPIVCDLDVDAPDLHLLLQPEHLQVEEFYSGHKAVIDAGRCRDCGLCLDYCRYGAITQSDGTFIVDPLKCEGCKVCVRFCPAEAIDFPENHCGRWYRSRTRFGPLIHAQLFPGEENSGRLVALLRRTAKETAQAEGKELILSDGAPGIGCPVISSLTGASLAVVVTEPTPSGRHDLERVLDLCRHFHIPAGVIVNKHDLNPANTKEIEAFCRERGLSVLARLPHDPAMTQAMVRGRVITEFTQGGLADLVRRAWLDIEALVNLKRAA